MRLSIIVIAVALLLSGAPMPAGAATNTTFAETVAPTEGGELEQTGNVTLAFGDWSWNATSVAGVVELDGEKVATFLRDLPEVTTAEWPWRFQFDVTLNATALAPADRVLSATLWTEEDAPVTTAPVTVRLVPTNPAPAVDVEATEYNRTLSSFVVRGTATDDGQVVEMRLETAFGSSSVWYPEAQFWLLKEATPKPGRHAGQVVAVDDRGRETRVDVTFDVANLPSEVEAKARYVVGDTIAVSGTATDPDGRIVTVSFLSDFGNRTIHFPREAWTFDVPAAPPEGNHTARLVVKDEHGGLTTQNLTFTVAAEFRTLYDATIPVSGGFARIDQVQLPRVLDGRMRFCPDAEACFTQGLAGDVYVAIGDRIDRPEKGCGKFGIGVSTSKPLDCDFTTNRQTLAHVQWALAGQGEIRVAIEGWVL